MVKFPNWICEMGEDLNRQYLKSNDDKRLKKIRFIEIRNFI
jgi:hypothetical protein